MVKILVAACSKLIEWVRSYQISYLILDLYHSRKTKLVFFQVSLLKVKTCLNRKLFMKTICLWQKNSAVLSYKNYRNRKIWLVRPTFSKLTATFKLHQWTQTKTKVPLWQPIKLIYVISRRLNRKEMHLWAKLHCIMPQLNAFCYMSTFLDFLFCLRLNKITFVYQSSLLKKLPTKLHNGKLKLIKRTWGRWGTFLRSQLCS